MKKASEELGELTEAILIGNSNEINEEGCDVIEVLISLLKVNTGISEEQILRRVLQKRESRGDFTGGLVWEHP